MELRSYGVNDVWAAIEKERKPKKGGEVGEDDVKVPEWNELISEKPIGKFPFFMCCKGEVPSLFTDVIRKVVLLDRLRKVNALVGFTRIEARDEFADEVTKPSGLCKGAPKFVPACEVFGEGLFLLLLTAEGAQVFLGLLPEQTKQRLARGEQVRRGVVKGLNLRKGALTSRGDVVKATLSRGVTDLPKGAFLAVGVKEGFPDLLTQGKRKKGSGVRPL